ncbi:hypothetical protein OR214_00636 [Ralstonia pickettii OR214]|jgi:hypothetical protein|uniref:Uncharacterized protein n=1 Tax=Ralstonia pickettii OR214 TaxID=1264675 RepID=R0E095_RALPI|nr:hypothetical protein OR214_00636 [Ralstonia pickettii OR214]
MADGGRALNSPVKLAAIYGNPWEHLSGVGMQTAAD